MNYSLDLQSLQKAYRSGELTPETVLADISELIRTHVDNPIWTHVLFDSELRPYFERLKKYDPSELPLYGIPFAIKDNIDLAHVMTTAACPEFAYMSKQSAFVVKQLIEAGAIPVGKTNLDQFATGLVGTRSPYGACSNSFNKEYISGGSSSGSALAVALGMATFALGTDTAGSGRVPASLNNILGVKPSKGILSTDGVVPACRSLDCVSIFALSSQDAEKVLSVSIEYDDGDPFARVYDKAPTRLVRSFTFGVLNKESRQFFGNTEAEKLYEESIERMISIGGEAIEFDYSVFNETALLLYNGPWVAERYAAVGDFIKNNPDDVYPVTKDIILGGAEYQAAEAFSSFYKLQELKKSADVIVENTDFLLLPTNGTTYRKNEIEEEPILYNSNLGYYTNFMNLLDYSGLAVPSGFYSNGIPFGVTLVGKVFADHQLLSFAKKYEGATRLNAGATSFRVNIEETDFVDSMEEYTTLAVCGAHMRELPLNLQLISLGAEFIEEVKSAPEYRFYALTYLDPVRPGMVKSSAGKSIDLELWALPTKEVGNFLAMIKAPLGLGTVSLIDGREVTGFVCESYVSDLADDITDIGSWREYLRK